MREAQAWAASTFLSSSRRSPARPALEVEGRVWTYEELRQRASSLAATLAAVTPEGGAPLTGVFAERSATAFAGVLGALLRGHGYLPLNPRFPPNRTRLMLEVARCRAMVVDAECANRLDDLLSGIVAPCAVVLPDLDRIDHLVARWPMHRFVSSSQLLPASAWEPRETDDNALACVLYTSGSTGLPKAVSIAHRNVASLVEKLALRYSVGEQDRFSFTCDLTFDPSIADMFLAWSAGACVCCPPQKALLNADAYIRDSRLTFWASVPSTVTLMARLGVLRQERYPLLRVSLFGGQALSEDLVEAWSRAAPHSLIENVYGTTETTVTSTAYRWDPLRSPAECVSGVVPIGDPLPGVATLVVDEALKPVPPGDEGELLIGGAQVTPGYLNDAPANARAFITLPGSADVFYRTGDRVRRPAAGEPLLFLGRYDEQIKILGVRVELAEVEGALRAELPTEGSSHVVAIGWPRHEGGARGIVAFLANESVDVRELRDRLAEKLPHYMVPTQIRVLAEMPVTPHGKVDKRALAQMLDHEVESSLANP
jgi:amino acid adenylation domain-containing protein